MCSNQFGIHPPIKHRTCNKFAVGRVVSAEIGNVEGDDNIWARECGNIIF